VNDPDVHPAALATRKAEHLLEAGHHEAAERAVRDALALVPDDSWLHVLLGRALVLADRREEAEQALGRALALDPEQVAALHLLAAICTEAGRHQEAETLLLEALRVDPVEPELYLAYGSLMRRTGHLDKSEQLLRRCLALAPENEAAHQELAALHTERDRHAHGAVHADLGLRLAPADERSHVAQASHLFATGHPLQARDAFREALRLDPTDRDIEEAWLEADMCSRWIYLPMYWWSLLLERLPGRQYTVWVAFVALMMVGRRVGLPGAIAATVAVAYLALVLYTWVATPLTRAWVKLVPPR